MASKGRSGASPRNAFQAMLAGGHIGIDLARPLRFAVRRVAVHVAVDDGDLAHQLGFQEAGGVGELAGGDPLVADLHHAPRARALVGRAHPLGVLHGERHGLFLVDVFARVERGREALGVQVLRRRDEHRVDVLVLQQTAVIGVRFGVGSDGAGLVQAARVDVGGADAIDVFAAPAPGGESPCRGRPAR